MLVHSENGKRHLLCYLLNRFPVHAAHNEGAAALRRQRIQYRLEMAKLIARLQRSLRRMIGLQHVQFRHKLQRDDFFPARLINQEVAGDLKQIGFAVGRGVDIAMGIGARHAFGDQVVNIAGTRHHAPQSSPKRAFMRKNCRLEPIKPDPDRFQPRSPMLP